jgi:hypothetical protein
MNDKEFDQKIDRVDGLTVLLETINEEFSNGKITPEEYKKKLNIAIDNYHKSTFDTREKVIAFCNRNNVPSYVEMKHWRKAINVKQSEVQEHCGFFLPRYENGDHDINSSNLKKLYDFYLKRTFKPETK